MKKGQLLSQPIIFIFAIIVAALILGWGSYQAYKLINLKSTMEVGTTLTDLKEKVDTYYNLDAGSSTEINLRLPSKVDYVCFTNPNNPFIIKDLDRIYPGLSQLLQAKGKNIFIIPPTFNPSTYNIPNLIPSENPLCIRTSGSLKGIIENKGTHVEISK